MTNINHIAIIMDGNGRWAQAKGRPRVWGHIRGMNTVKEIVEASTSLKLESLTLYAFSTENWSRPHSEVFSLFKLFDKFLNREKKRIIENNIQFRVIGDYTVLTDSTKTIIRDLEKSTRNNNGLKLSLAFNYGGRKEIIDAVNKAINTGDKVTEETFSKLFYRPEVADIDLVIRTGGDHRLSNFLIWQTSYSEIHFTSTMWPSFTVDEFVEIINRYESVERRFGTIQKGCNYQDAKKLAQSRAKGYIDETQYWH